MAVKMNKKIKKILTIVSIVIIILGIIFALGVSNELINSNNDVYVDGTDFSGISELISFMGAKLLGFVIIIYSLLLDVAIWAIYLITILIMKIVKWLKKKKNENNYL